MNNREIIDISVPLSNQLPIWPGGYGLSISSLTQIGNNSESNVSRLDLDVHCGTHIDAPLHFFAGGKTTNELALDRLLGSCFVTELPEDITKITALDLDRLNIPKETTRLLLKTINSYQNLWDKKEFYKDFCALSADAAQWVVNKGIDLIGIDYCSIQNFFDPITTHQILLNNEVIILEGLDLRRVKSGNYKLTCLPISVEGVEGVPVRAILQKNPN